MTNRLASLYLELKLISAAREMTTMIAGKPTEYNLLRGREVIDEIITEEKINEHRVRVRR